MVGFALRSALRMLTIAGLVYVTFFVPIGPRTLYGHVSRIAATKEAHDLVDAMSSTAKQAAQAVAERVKSDAAH